MNVGEREDKKMALKSDDKDEERGLIRLTVWRKSLMFSCKGFTVIDSKGNLVYRVDNYMEGHKEEVILMDAAGYTILTMRRKRLSMPDSWLVFEGEVVEEEEEEDFTSGWPKNKKKKEKKKKKKRPFCYVRKHVNLVPNSKSKVLAHVLYEPSCKDRLSYVIEGSYERRSCKVVEKSRSKVVAEMKRKDDMIKGISLWEDVFLLMVIDPNFHPAFAMAFVLLLDQMFS
ncbi:protein LURP-one-related 8-like [Magnolia sinica]|uniref:protein LURP-one-related 8-like n=1 Tax=Magnolia sinica TaxID=86752 RepID=UPI002659730C|nr:protein LURP-one-related 8-like [Magnolia sinica]